MFRLVAHAWPGNFIGTRGPFFSVVSTDAPSLKSIESREGTRKEVRTRSVFWPNFPAGGAMNAGQMDELIERDPVTLGVPLKDKVLSASATFPSHAKFLFLLFLLTLPLLNSWVRG